MCWYFLRALSGRPDSLGGLRKKKGSIITSLSRCSSLVNVWCMECFCDHHSTECPLSSVGMYLSASHKGPRPCT